MPRSIVITEEYAHPPEAVWALLTQSDQIARWLMPNDFVPEVNRSFTLRTRPRPGFDGIVRCRVLELDPPKRMRWSWASGKFDSVVIFELLPTRAGTRLTLRHEGFRGAAQLLPWFIMRHGWAKKLKVSLPAAFADPAEETS